MVIYLNMLTTYLNKNYGESFYETYNDKSGCSPILLQGGRKLYDLPSALNHMSKIESNKGCCLFILMRG